jgi:hypothetical protein
VRARRCPVLTQYYFSLAFCERVLQHLRKTVCNTLGSILGPRVIFKPNRNNLFEELNVTEIYTDATHNTLTFIVKIYNEGFHS